MNKEIKYDKFEIYHYDNKIADIELNPNNKLGTIKVKQYTNDFFRQFKKPDEEVTSEDFHKWLKWRTFPEDRANRDEILHLLGLKSYNRLDIIAKTHAVMADDDIWVKFDGEELTYKDVSLRKY